MSYSNLSESLVALLLFTIAVSLSFKQESLTLDSTRAALYVLGGKPTALPNYQLHSLVSSNAWRGLVPLKSTRADVERILGSEKGLIAESYSYETKEEKVRVVYSYGYCEPSLEGRWNVPVDTVLSITVFPQSKLLINTLRLDKTYSRSQETHPENWLYYVSPEKGVMIHAMLNNGYEEVMSITYRPMRNNEKLHCQTRSYLKAANS